MDSTIMIYYMQNKRGIVSDHQTCWTSGGQTFFCFCQSLLLIVHLLDKCGNFEQFSFITFSRSLTITFIKQFAQFFLDGTAKKGLLMSRCSWCVKTLESTRHTGFNSVKECPFVYFLVLCQPCSSAMPCILLAVYTCELCGLFSHSWVCIWPTIH